MISSSSASQNATPPHGRGTAETVAHEQHEVGGAFLRRLSCRAAQRLARSRRSREPDCSSAAGDGANTAPARSSSRRANATTACTASPAARSESAGSTPTATRCCWGSPIPATPSDTVRSSPAASTRPARKRSARAWCAISTARRSRRCWPTIRRSACDSSNARSSSSNTLTTRCSGRRRCRTATSSCTFCSSSCARHGRRRVDGSQSIDLPVSRRDLASMIGTRHETISRIIGRLETDGMAHFSGRQVIIPSVEALAAEIHWLGSGVISAASSAISEKIDDRHRRSPRPALAHHPHKTQKGAGHGRHLHSRLRLPGLPGAQPRRTGARRPQPPPTAEVLRRRRRHDGAVGGRRRAHGGGGDGAGAAAGHLAARPGMHRVHRIAAALLPPDDRSRSCSTSSRSIITTRCASAPESRRSPTSTR